MQSMNEKMEGEVFISRQILHFSFIDNMIKVLFTICTLNWRVNIYVSRQGKKYERQKRKYFYYYIYCGFLVLY